MSQRINYYFDEFGVFADSFPALEGAVAPPDNALWVAPPARQAGPDGPDQPAKQNQADTPEPDLPEGHVIMVNAARGGWEIQPDYRGRGAYNPRGEWEQVWQPGPLPPGWTPEPPEPTAEQACQARIAERKMLLVQNKIHAERPAQAILNITIGAELEQRALTDEERYRLDEESTWLMNYEDEAQALRQTLRAELQELKELQKLRELQELQEPEHSTNSAGSADSTGAAAWPS